MAVVVKDSARNNIVPKAVAGPDGFKGTVRDFTQVMTWLEDQVDPHITTMNRKYQPPSITGDIPEYDDTGHIFGWTPMLLDPLYAFNFLPGTAFTDVSMVTEAQPGDPVAAVKNHDDVLSVVQATGTRHPIYTRHPLSGVRNLLDNSEDLTAQGYALVGGATIVDAETISVLADSSSRVSVTNSVSLTGTNDITLSYDIWTDDPLGIGQTIQATMNLEGVNNVNQSPVLTNTPQRVTHTALASLATGVGTRFQNINGAAAFTFKVSNIQIEVNTEATNYQSRVSQYDVTENGQRTCYGLWTDGVDDALTAEIATVFENEACIASSSTLFTEVNDVGTPVGFGNLTTPNFGLLSRSPYSTGNFLQRGISARGSSGTASFVVPEDVPVGNSYGIIGTMFVDGSNDAQHAYTLSAEASRANVMGGTKIDDMQFTIGMNTLDGTAFEGVVWCAFGFTRRLTPEERQELLMWMSRNSPAWAAL